MTCLQLNVEEIDESLKSFVLQGQNELQSIFLKRQCKVVFLRRRLRPRELEGSTLVVAKTWYLKVNTNITLPSVKSSADAGFSLLFFCFFYIQS